MQKFTRPITREIEAGGERLALTLSAEGVSLRPVGSRGTPWEISWGAILGQLAAGAKAPAEAEVAAAVAALKKGKSAKKGGNPAKAAASEPAPEETSASGSAADEGELAPLLERLERWLKKHRPRYLKELRPGASPEELTALEGQLGLRLPEDLKTLLSWHNGQGEETGGRFEQDWLLMGTDAVAAAKQELDRQAHGNGNKTGWQAPWIPFLDDDAGDYLCLDTSLTGEPVRAFWLGKAEHPVIAPSLTEWLREFVTAAEAGEYHEDPERGTFLRRSAAQ